MGVKTEGVRCKCAHGKRPQDENVKENKGKQKSGTEKGRVKTKKKMNAEGLPSSSGEN